MNNYYDKRTMLGDCCIIIAYITWLALGVIGAISIVVPLESIIGTSFGLEIFKYMCAISAFSWIVFGAYKSISKR